MQHQFKFGLLTNIDLVTKLDPRKSFMDVLRQKTPWLDPEYQELEPLFRAAGWSATSRVTCTGQDTVVLQR